VVFTVTGTVLTCAVVREAAVRLVLDADSSTRGIPFGKSHFNPLYFRCAAKPGTSAHAKSQVYLDERDD
jgi:hypothetical protein